MPSGPKTLLKQIGPGFITGAADDDPSGIATYSQTGAIFGFSQLWLAPFSFPFMVAVQQMCGRIGLVTGKGLAGAIRINYPRWVLYAAVALLVTANTINIGADLGAMATSAQMLLRLPFAFWLIVMTALITFLEVFVSYKTYAKTLKYLALTLFAYVLTAFISKPDWAVIGRSTVLPAIRFSGDYVLNVVAILGTTISPYLFFWQGAQEVEESVTEGKIRDMGVGKPKLTQRDVTRLNRDTIVGMLFSQVIMFSIIVTAAVTLHANGITEITTASQAAEALRPVAGDLAYVLFAAGIIGTGLLAVPVLAGSSAYAVAETMGMKEGLDKKVSRAPGFYAVIGASTVVGMLINATGIDPIRALYYAAALNGLAAPPLLALVILTARNKRVMGRFVNGGLANLAGWTVVVVMAAAGIVLIADMLNGMS